MSDVPAETPVLDLLATMTAASVEASGLDPQTLMLVRIAALVAVDAPPSSYLLNLGAAGEIGSMASGSETSSQPSHRLWERPASPPR